MGQCSHAQSRENADARRYRDTLADLRAALEVPANIPKENLTAAGRGAEIAYWTGVASRGLGQHDRARQFWEKGAMPAGPSPRDLGPRGRVA